MTRTRLLILAAIAAALALAPAAYSAYQFTNTAWGTTGSGPGQFQNAGMIAVSSADGSVYVADTGNNRVQRFTSDGAQQNETPAGLFNSPAAVAVGPDGTVYVTDTGNNRVHHLSADLQTSLSAPVGSQGNLSGQFNGPTGIGVGPDGSVYVADSGNQRVERFLPDLTHVSNLPTGAGSVLQGVAVGTDGVVYVVDSGNERVDRFGTNDALIDSFGTPGTNNGQFQNPRGVAANAAGVYVADLSQNRVQKFTTAGSFVDSLDAASSGDSAFNGPWGVGLSSTGLVYVSQNTSSRVAAYTDTGTGGTGGTGGGGGGSADATGNPETGVSAGAKPISGSVRIKRPGSTQFETLTAGDTIPIGSIVDVTNGTVAITTTGANKTIQTSRFFSGVFQLLQDKSKRPVTEARLYGGNFKKACPKARRGSVSATGSAKKKVVRALWGSGKGKFRTKGRYSSAAIRGTEWLTQDRCDGTNVRVKQGVVTVRDLVKRKNVIVRAPKSYFAAAKPAKKKR